MRQALVGSVRVGAHAGIGAWVHARRHTRTVVQACVHMGARMHWRNSIDVVFREAENKLREQAPRGHRVDQSRVRV